MQLKVSGCNLNHFYCTLFKRKQKTLFQTFMNENYILENENYEDLKGVIPFGRHGGTVDSEVASQQDDRRSNPQIGRGTFQCGVCLFSSCT